MINKLDFQSIVSKYHLKGLVESVKWKVEDNSLKIKFISTNKNMVGEISYSNFPTTDACIAILNTSQLLKLINITAGDLVLDLIKKENTFVKFAIADKQYNLNYSLSELHLVPEPPTIEEPKYDVEIILESENISPLVKAKEALSDVDHVYVCSHIDSYGNKGIEFIFGENNEYSNKISYFIPSDNVIYNSNKDFKILFNSNVLKEILSANKDINAKMNLSLEGLLKIEFEGDNLKNKYFLIQEPD
jgi:hypothetical protein